MMSRLTMAYIPILANTVAAALTLIPAYICDSCSDTGRHNVWTLIRRSPIQEVQ